MKSTYTRIAIIIFTIIIPFTLLATGVRKLAFEHTSKINIGFQYGPNFTQVTRHFYQTIPYYNYYTNLTPTVRHSGGLFFQYDFNSISSIHTSIFYERKCLEQKVAPDNYIGYAGTGKTYAIYDCLMLPVLYRVTFNRFFINAGGYGGYLIRGVLKFSETPNGTMIYQRKYTKRFYKGITAGMGYIVLKNNLFSVSAELRDNFDLTNENSFNSENPIRLNTIDLLFSIAFKL